MMADVSLNTLEEWHNGGKLAGKAACQKNRSKETLGTPQKNWTHKLKLLWKADPEETVFVGHLFEVFEMCYSGVSFCCMSDTPKPRSVGASHILHRDLEVQVEET
jgi:hypothetical protein